MMKILSYLLLFLCSNLVSGQSNSQSGQKILMVISNANFYGKSDIPTANHFQEIIFPYEEFIQAGYDIDFVSPNGGKVPLGYIDEKDPLAKRYLNNSAFMEQLKSTFSPADLDYKNYKAIFYAGGGAAMFGVPENLHLQQIAKNIYEKNNGVISAICHGSAGIVNIKISNGEYLIAGKNINGFPDCFENKKDKYYQEFPFSIEEKIESHGGHFSHSLDGWDGYYLTDGRIVTGQDPASAIPMAKKIIEILKSR